MSVGPVSTQLHKLVEIIKKTGLAAILFCLRTLSGNTYKNQMRLSVWKEKRRELYLLKFAFLCQCSVGRYLGT